MIDLREKIIDQAIKGALILSEYFEGKRPGSDLIKHASKAIDRGLKADHLNQIQKNTERSFGLRLLQYLPKDATLRKKYIQLTNPEIKGILMAKPEK